MLPRHERLRNELLGFEERISGSGGFTYGARGKNHDDYVALLITAAIADAWPALRIAHARHDHGRRAARSSGPRRGDATTRDSAAVGRVILGQCETAPIAYPAGMRVGLVALLSLAACGAMRPTVTVTAPPAPKAPERPPELAPYDPNPLTYDAGPETNARRRAEADVRGFRECMFEVDRSPQAREYAGFDPNGLYADLMSRTRERCWAAHRCDSVQANGLACTYGR